MLEGGKLGKFEFEKGQIVMARRLDQKSADLWGGPGLQWIASIKSGPRKEQW